MIQSTPAVNISVPLSEIKRVASLSKKNAESYPQVFLNIGSDGMIEARWFFGRSDFVLSPGFIVLLLLDEYNEDAIVYAIRMVIRNQEGYYVDISK